MRLSTPAPWLFAFVSLIACLPGSARVGETQEEFERRLFQPSVGKFIPRDKNPDPIKEEEMLRQQPFNAVRVYFPVEVRERKYWKSAVPNVLSNDDGWRVHVFFQDNRSVLEAYQRVGDVLSAFEIQNILQANRGASEWRKVEPGSLEALASAIGSDYELADGSLRARIAGNWLMVFSVTFDKHVKEQVRRSEDHRARQEKDRLRRQEIKAPGSTSGF